MKEYTDLMQDVLKHGRLKEDRTGVGTYGVFGRMVHFDLTQGFPLLTTKRVPFRLVASELLWFLKGDTKLRYLLQHNNHIWDEWAFKKWVESTDYTGPDMTDFGKRCLVDEEFNKEYQKQLKIYQDKVLNDDDFNDKYGDLGPIYSKQWCNINPHNEYRFVNKRIKENKENVIQYPLFDLKEVDNKKTDDLVGKIFENTVGQKYKVISLNLNKDDSHRKQYMIQFLYTGYTKDNVRRDIVMKGNIKDIYYPSYNNIGYLGELNVNLSDDMIKKLDSCWRKMLDRCYNENCKEYLNYGKKGVFVDKSWFNRANFIKDVMYLPNWVVKRENIKQYQLDKDYYGSNCYSKDTCVWLDKNENKTYKNTSIPVKFIINNNEFIFPSLSEGCKTLGLSYKAAFNRLNKTLKRKPTDFDVEVLDLQDKLLRKPLQINQIQWVIDEIKNNPTSRRLLVNAWNPEDVQKGTMALPPCHYSFEFEVYDGKLSCIFNMRSNDVFLGLPFNIASYALLTHLVANECGLEVGELVYSGADVHIYTNHLEQCKEQLSREHKELPELYIINKDKSIFDMEITDFEITNYNPHPTIKAPVAV